MKHRLLAAAAGLLLVFSMPGLSLAAGVLDQSNTVNDMGMGGSVSLAQTFTVGITGELAGVDVYLKVPAGSMIQIDIETVDRSTKWPKSVLTKAKGPWTGPGWFHVEVAAAHLHFVAGAQLAIAFTLPDLTSTVGASADTAYPQGKGWRLDGPGWHWTALGRDLDFRTYMIPDPPAATPTPTPKPTVKPTAAATPTLFSPTATDSPVASPDMPSPTVITSPSAAASAQATPDPPAGGSGGLPIPLVLVGGVVLVAAAVGGGVLLGRRQRR